MVAAAASGVNKQSIKRRMKKQQLRKSQKHGDSGATVPTGETVAASLATGEEVDEGRSNVEHEKEGVVSIIAAGTDSPHTETPSLLPPPTIVPTEDDEAGAISDSSAETSEDEDKKYTPRSPSSPISLSPPHMPCRHQLRPRSHSFAGSFPIQQFAAIEAYDHLADQRDPAPLVHQAVTTSLRAHDSDDDNADDGEQAINPAPRDTSTERERKRRGYPLIVDGSGPHFMVSGGFPMFFGHGRDGSLGSFPVIVDGSVVSSVQRRRRRETDTKTETAMDGER